MITHQPTHQANTPQSQSRTLSYSALSASPGARALYDAERASGTGHNPALRKLANRLVGILHGCLKTRTLYDEATAWPHKEKTPQSDIAA